MATPYNHDARSKDVDEALAGDLRKLVEGAQSTSAAIENIKKKTVGIWVVASALVAITFEFGVWVTNYNRNAQDGSPALVKLDEKWTKQQADNFNELNAKITAISSKDDARYDKLNEILIKVSTIQEQQAQRMDRWENKR